MKAEIKNEDCKIVKYHTDGYLAFAINLDIVENEDISNMVQIYVTHAPSLNTYIYIIYEDMLNEKCYDYDLCIDSLNMISIINNKKTLFIPHKIYIIANSILRANISISMMKSEKIIDLPKISLDFIVRNLKSALNNE